jgi:hypothetical protein
VDRETGQRHHGHSVNHGERTIEKGEEEHDYRARNAAIRAVEEATRRIREAVTRAVFAARALANSSKRTAARSRGAEAGSGEERPENYGSFRGDEKARRSAYEAVKRFSDVAEVFVRNHREVKYKARKKLRPLKGPRP